MAWPLRNGAANTGTVVDSVGYGTATNAFANNTVATACNNLQALVNQVNDLRTIGTLTDAQAAPLLAGAIDLRQEYGC